MLLGKNGLIKSLPLCPLPWPPLASLQKNINNCPLSVNWVFSTALYCEMVRSEQLWKNIFLMLLKTEPIYLQKAYCDTKIFVVYIWLIQFMSKHLKYSQQLSNQYSSPPIFKLPVFDAFLYFLIQAVKTRR